METEQERAQRRRQRALFDGVASGYEASRPGYPDDIVRFTLATAGVGVGASTDVGVDAGQTVLEVGCGTGQLTEHLARAAINLTAIDIGPSMVAAARHRLAGRRPTAGVTFRVTSFENLAAAAASFGLIVSGAAFHWIDPEVRFRKSAELLAPGGWLAILDTDERYDDSFGAVLHGLWAERAGGGGAWTQRRADAEVIAEAGWLEPPVVRTVTRRITRTAEQVVAVENTRATSLSWPDDIRREFTAQLRRHLAAHPTVQLSQQASVVMARLRSHPS